MGQERGGTPYQAWDSRSDAQGRPTDAETTWTLVSLDEMGRLVRVWHQHGEGATPVRLDPEPVSANAAPLITARAYTCGECEALTIVSRPASPLS